MRSAHQSLLSFLILCMILTGCVATDSTAGSFAHATALSSLAGTYRNQGESPNTSTKQPRLSQLIWPDDMSLRHGEVASVEVKVLSARRLKVSALGQNGETLKAGEYEQGKNFSLTGDRLRLAHRLDGAGFKSGQPIVGTTSNQVEFGLDSAGQGKARQASSATGLVFGLIPMHIEAVSDIRYVKVK